MRISTKGARPSRHSPDVNALLSVMLLLAGLAATDHPADRMAIAKTLATHNFDRGGGGLWSEVTRPTIAIDSVRFQGPDTALVHGSLNQYGSAIIVRRIRVGVVLQKRDGQWRVTSVAP